MEIKQITTDKPIEKTTHWFETSEGTKLFLPYHWGTKVNLKDMTFVSFHDKDYLLCDFPTISELQQQGKILSEVKFPYQCYNLDYHSFPTYFANRKLNIKKVMKYFNNKGINVTEEAIQHNFNAWKSGMKSGYRDCKNGYHLFTPCGLNPLSFRVTTLHTACEDWQTTYEC